MTTDVIFSAKKQLKEEVEGVLRAKSKGQYQLFLKNSTTLGAGYTGSYSRLAIPY